MAPQYPLRGVTNNQLKHLGQLLWSWKLCDECLAGKPCQTDECPWQRSKILGRFFEFYKGTTATYEAETEQGHQSILQTHEDLFRIIGELKITSSITRRELMEKLFTDRPARTNQERAVNLAVRILLMVNCSASRQSSDLLEHGMLQIPWRSNVSLSQYIQDAFPENDHPSIAEIKEKLRGRKLKKRAGLRFVSTDDLKSHLKMDRKTAVVKIFHHTAFLKEQLRLTKDYPSNMSTPDYIKLGVLPRRLVLETLDTLQQILFPLNEAKSKSFLLSLTSLNNFDADILRYDSISIRNPDEMNVLYHYFGARLADLYDEMMNPTPRGLQRWFERKAGPRYVMMATLAGVFLAIMLGFASLALGGYQAWIGYQQWQHPIQN